MTIIKPKTTKPLHTAPNIVHDEQHLRGLATIFCMWIHLIINYYCIFDLVFNPETITYQFEYGYALRYTSISSTSTLRYTQHPLAIYFHTLYCAFSHTFIHFHTFSYTLQNSSIHFTIHVMKTLSCTLRYTFIHFTIHSHPISYTPYTSRYTFIHFHTLHTLYDTLSYTSYTFQYTFIHFYTLSYTL